MSAEEEQIPDWKTTSRRVVAKNSFLALEAHHRKEDGSDREGDFFIVRAPNWVNVIAITEDDQVVLIEQFRQGSEKVELEIPSGIIDESEDPATAALRELTEETGYERTDKSEFRKIGDVNPNPAFMTNRCFTYLVTNVRPSGKTDFDEHENIRVRLVPRSEIERIISAGEIEHALIIAAFYWMRLAGY